jgi:16S rRNA (uracil1498-N3)-methyltransferase
MNLPFFYVEGMSERDTVITLNEDASRHIVQVLRMKANEKIRLTDGLGNAYTAEIIKEHKKATEVQILSSVSQPPAQVRSTIAISLIKNTSRFEWFLEKATELGINAIVPLICERTEKQHFRQDRMKNILISAMLQSQQTWLPELPEPVLFASFIQETQDGKKLIAHCMDGKKNGLATALKEQTASVILIGPEGDFSADEIEKAVENGFLPVALGNTRLRTETAGVAAAVMMKLTSDN